MVLGNPNLGLGLQWDRLGPPGTNFPLGAEVYHGATFYWRMFGSGVDGARVPSLWKGPGKCPIWTLVGQICPFGSGVPRDGARICRPLNGPPLMGPNQTLFVCIIIWTPVCGPRGAKGKKPYPEMTHLRG